MRDKSKGQAIVKRMIALVLLSFAALPLLAQAPPGQLPSGEVRTRITTNQIRRYKIVVAPLPVSDPTMPDIHAQAQELREVVLADLDFSLRFDLVNRNMDELTFAALSSDKGSVDYVGWKGTGSDYLVAGSFLMVGGKPSTEIRVYDLSLGDLVFLKNYELDLDHIRKVAHHISDDIVLNITGERGVAGTRIAFVSQTAKRSKDIFICDYDGYNVVRLTSDSTLAKSPTWSPDGTQIAYTNLQDGDADIYVLNVASKRAKVLYAAKGVDQAPDWCKRNGFMAFSSSATGNQEIYYLPPGEHKPRRLTYSFAMDFEPSWSPNGEELAFASTRAGNPHIFIMGADGLNVRRLTFESRNTTPRWRPLPFGDKVVLTTEVGLFQIAIIDTNGDNFIQLTTDGENRDACWSPDGLHIIFCSDRRGGRGNFELFVMDWDGRNQHPLNTRFRDGSAPAWSPFAE